MSEGTIRVLASVNTYARKKYSIHFTGREKDELARAMIIYCKYRPRFDSIEVL